MDGVLSETLRQRHTLIADVEELIGWGALRGHTFRPELITAMSEAKASIDTADSTWLPKIVSVASEVAREVGEEGKLKLEEIESNRSAASSSRRRFGRLALTILNGATTIYTFAILLVVALALLSMLVSSQAFMLESAKKTVVEAERLVAEIILLEQKTTLTNDEGGRLARARARVRTLASENFELTRSMCSHSQNFLVRWMSVSEQTREDCDPDQEAERGIPYVRAAIVGDRFARLANFVIPVLAGFLGALVLVVRLRLGVAHGVASQAGGPSMWLRLILGALCGLAIGWFVQPLGPSTVSSNGVGGTGVGTQWSLAPFALAFLAGYSVEVVFGILDRVSAAIVGPTKSG